MIQGSVNVDLIRTSSKMCKLFEEFSVRVTLIEKVSTSTDGRNKRELHSPSSDLECWLEKTD